MTREGTPLHKGRPHCQLSGRKTHLQIRGDDMAGREKSLTGSRVLGVFQGQQRVAGQTKQKESDR